MNPDVKLRYDHFLKFTPTVAEFIKDLKKNTLIKIEKKGRIDLVTEADKGSEQMIRSELAKFFPEDSILGEEYGLIEGKTSYKWIIDPIDGTTNFAHNLPLYCISIGLEDISTNEIVMGIVCMPDLNEIYHAVKGNGAYKNGLPIKVSDAVDLENSLLCTGFPVGNQEKIEEYGQLYINFLKKTRGVRRTGSAAMDLCWVAEGRYDGFYEFGLNPWDTAGAMRVILEAGGKITTTTGDAYNQYIPSILASNGKIQDQMLKEFSPVKKE